MSRTRTGVSEVVDFWSHYGTPEEEYYSGKGKGQVKGVNDEIFHFLGFDKEVLLNSCFVEQKKIDEFLVKTKKDRKLIIDKLLNLEKLNYLKDDYKEQKKYLEKLVNYLEIQADTADKRSKLEILDQKTKEIQKIEQKNVFLQAFTLKCDQIGLDYVELVKTNKTKQQKNAELNEQELKLKQEITKLDKYSKNIAKLKSFEIQKEQNKNLSTKKSQVIKDLEKNLHDSQSTLKQNKLDKEEKTRLEKIGRELKKKIEKIQKQNIQLKEGEMLDQTAQGLEEKKKTTQEQVKKNSNKISIIINKVETEIEAKAHKFEEEKASFQDSFKKLNECSSLEKKLQEQSKFHTKHENLQTKQSSLESELKSMKENPF